MSNLLDFLYVKGFLLAGKQVKNLSIGGKKYWTANKHTHEYTIFSYQWNDDYTSCYGCAACECGEVRLEEDTFNITE